METFGLSSALDIHLEWVKNINDPSKRPFSMLAKHAECPFSYLRPYIYHITRLELIKTNVSLKY